jgi:hypothetical protein
LLLKSFLELLEIGEEIVDELHLFRWRYIGEELIDLIADRYGVDKEGAVSLVVEGVGVSSVQVDEGSHFLGMAGADGTEFFASDGVSGEDGAIEMEGVDDGEDVVAEAVGLVVGGGRCGGGRGAEAAAGDAVNVVAGGEFGSEFVPDVGVVAEAGEEDERTPGATPVKDFEFYIFVDGDELDFVWGGIDGPCGGFGCALESEGNSFALREDAGDGVAVGGEDSFEGDVDRVYAEPYSRAAERKRGERHTVRTLVDAVDRSFPRGVLAFFNLKDDAKLLFEVEGALPAAGEILRVNRHRRKEQDCDRRNDAKDAAHGRLRFRTGVLSMTS